MGSAMKKDLKDAPLIYVINFIVILLVLFALFWFGSGNELEQINNTLEQILDELRNNPVR